MMDERRDERRDSEIAGDVKYCIAEGARGRMLGGNNSVTNAPIYTSVAGILFRCVSLVDVELPLSHILTLHCAVGPYYYGAATRVKEVLR